MASIERKDVMNMVAIMCAGVFANPASGMQDQYSRQTAIQQMIWDTQAAIQGAGMNIIEPDEDFYLKPKIGKRFFYKEKEEIGTRQSSLIWEFFPSI